MKLLCNLCGDEFEADEFDCINTDGEITITCPNDCCVETITLGDFGDVTVIKGD